MKCHKCGVELTSLNHFFVPAKDTEKGRRYCIECARKENIITLI